MARSIPEKLWLEELAREAHYHPGELAQRLGMSRRQLCRLFQQHLECSPQAWLAELRMRDVEGCLLSSGLVKEASVLAGFNQVPSFCRWIKAQKHLTALEFAALLSSGRTERTASERTTDSQS